MYGLDMINTSVLGALGCDMNTFLRYFPAAETMYSLLVALAIGLILLGWVWNLFKNYGLGLGIEAEDPVRLTAKAILFIVLAYYADEIVNIALTIGGTPYAWILSSELPSLDFASFNSVLLTIIGVCANGGVALIVLILTLILAWNYIKLLFEAAERYIYIDEIPGGLSGRFYLRELEAADGYILDKQYKTVYVSPGKTVEIEWENTAVTGQIQIYKCAAEYNEVTGTAPGTPLKGAVYEIVNARSGKVVDYITTDARGVAASKPLPLTRYQLREVTAPAYWQLDPTVHDVTPEYPGQIIKLSAYDKPSSLGVTITKRGNAQVMAGQSMRYDLTVANTSNVPLESFFWHDKIPYDVARPTTLTTGTYSARLNYRILYKTNYNASYQVLASNLLTGNNYSFALNAIPMQAGEVVTDIYFDFGKVPVGFQSTVNPTLSVMVNGNAVNGYQMVNRADVGGKYQGTWQTATASWVTIIRRLWNTPTLPKTGY